MAISQVNGTTVTAGLAAKAAEKAAHKKGKRKRKPKQEDQAVDDTKSELEDIDYVSEAIEEASQKDTIPTEDQKPIPVDEADSQGRIVAVDWALSKAKWEEAKKQVQTGEEQAGEETDNSESETEAIGVHENDSESEADSASEQSDDDKMDEDNDADQPHNPPPPEEGTTLFVRNVPFEASDEDLRVL
jgi:nucleolar protein 4